MNLSQMNYATFRVSQIEKAKELELKKKHETPAKTITTAERASLIRSGKVKLHANVTTLDPYSDIGDVFDFSKYEQEKSPDSKLGPALAALKKAADSVRDEIMLGDAAKAKQLLAQFEK